MTHSFSSYLLYFLCSDTLYADIHQTTFEAKTITGTQSIIYPGEKVKGESFTEKERNRKCALKKY